MLAAVYSTLRSTGKAKRLSDLRAELGAHERTVTNALNLLIEAGLVEPTGDGFRACRRVAPEKAVAAALAVHEFYERDRYRGWAATGTPSATANFTMSVR